MFIYGRSENKSLPNLERDILIGGNSEHISLLSIEQEFINWWQLSAYISAQIIVGFIN